MRRVLLPALAGLVVLAAPAAALDVTGCGVVVPARQTAVLQADIDCATGAPGLPQYGIVLERGARLELNGHTLRQVGTSLLTSVYCLGKCDVTGPGRLTTQIVGAAVASFGRGPVRVTALTTDDLIVGLYAPFARLVVTDVEVQAKISGIVGRRITLTDVSVALTGPSADFCIEAAQRGNVRGAGVSLAGCDVGIRAERSVDLLGLTSTGGRIGVQSGGVIRLTDSSVTGTTTPPDGLDLLSRRRPALVNTVCGRSGRLDDTWPVLPAVPWGVCSAD